MPLHGRENTAIDFEGEIKYLNELKRERMKKPSEVEMYCANCAEFIGVRESPVDTPLTDLLEFTCADCHEKEGE